MNAGVLMLSWLVINVSNLAFFSRQLHFSFCSVGVQGRTSDEILSYSIFYHMPLDDIDKQVQLGQNNLQ